MGRKPKKREGVGVRVSSFVWYGEDANLINQYMELTKSGRVTTAIQDVLRKYLALEIEAQNERMSTLRRG